MAVGEGSAEPEDDDKTKTENGPPPPETASTGGNDADEGDEDEEDEEPRLKYATLTKSLVSLYRNGDASSTFFMAGDKMIVGTHNGNIHVLSLPSFQPLKTYHGHSASISAISISPFPPPLPTTKLDAAQRLAEESATEPEKHGSSSPGSKNNPRQTPVPPTPSNQIHIATASIDGNVCIQSLVDPKDVQLRNFGRPVQSVALSPEFKSDKSYLSGGQAGSLILTTGGQAGRSTNATTTGASAAASGWLGSIGLGANTGSDKVLHSGEGIISTIKWSLSGKFVLWVNEEGIKIMRSHLKLESAESGSEWKRVSHINKPNRAGWEEMAGVWKARAEWVDRDGLEIEEDHALGRGTSANGTSATNTGNTRQQDGSEDVVVGWGDTVWFVKVHPASAKSSGENVAGRAEVTKIMQFNDCTISGVSQYTPNLLLVLAYMERKGKPESKRSGDKAAKQSRHRQNALEPELRLVDINSREEIDADTLTISRFETLSASDYHLSILPPIRVPVSLAQKGYLGALGSGMSTGMSTIGTGVGVIGSGLYTGVETVGQGMWDATMYAPRALGANRIFSGADSVRSGGSGADKKGSVKGANYLTGWIPSFGMIPSFGKGKGNEELNDVARTAGMKIFICSPYDCIVAVKRNMADRLQWLVKMERYKQAWELLDQYPEAVAPPSEPSEAPSPPTPSKASSMAPSGSAMSPSRTQVQQQATLAEFFAESSSITSASNLRSKNSIAEKEKRRVGELWLQQLVVAKSWQEAGEVAGKVLNTTTSWEHWIWLFVRNKKFDEISPVVPTFQLTPPLPSLIFEIILGHYVSDDRAKFKELLDLWPSDLFEISTISNAIEDQLQTDTTPKGSTDWRMLQECLAKLYLADGRYKEALRCYVRLQDADTALAMIKEHHLVDAIADDIPSFILLRIPNDQLKTASNDELDELSSDPIKLLVDEANNGVVEPEIVVSQLEESSNLLFLFFYLRSLWRGEGTDQAPTVPRVGHLAAVTSLAADEGKSLVEQFADTAVELFAEYDRGLLMEFLHTSTSYTFEKAVQICEQRHYVEELVYLLSKTGQLKKALFLIIDELKDVSKAIAFAKEQNDKGLWDDLLEYSMTRPKFISGLLAEVGTAIDPITLVKRIPSGLEIQGLKDGLKKMIREYDLQDSISSGASKVFYSEVAVRMAALRSGRRRGIKFDVTVGAKKTRSRGKDTVTEAAPQEERPPTPSKELEPGQCAGCGEVFVPDERETLVGFACGHVFHLSHLLHDPKSKDDLPTPPPEPTGQEGDDSTETAFTRTIDPKVTHARLLKDKIEAIRGCRICRTEKLKIEQV